MCPPLVLFNIYFSAMVAHWRGHCPQAGVNVKYKHGGKLVGDGTTKSRLSKVRVAEFQFADDAAIYAKTHDTFEKATKLFVESASNWGLPVSSEKTKGMVVG